MLKKKTLTQRQKDTLKKHSKHHTKKHMDMMKDLMKYGLSFRQSHTITMKYIGK